MDIVLSSVLRRLDIQTGIKAKRPSRMVNLLLMSWIWGQETPFDMRFENELQRNQNFLVVDQKLVATVCQ